MRVRVRRETSVRQAAAIATLLLLVSFSVALSRAATAAQETPCADTDRLVTEEQFELAQSEYLELLEDPNARDCAIAGLQALGVARQNDECAVGDALAGAREIEEARKAYLEDIKHPAERECAAEGLASVGQTPLGRVFDWLVDVLGSPLEALLKILGIAVVVLFTLAILRQGRRRQLVLTDLSDATGLQGFEKQAVGISQLLREHVAEELMNLARTYQHVVTVTRGHPPPGISPPAAAALSRYPPPAARLDTTAADLAATLKDVPGGLGPFVQAIVSALFRPKGSMVGGYFQREGEAPDRLGISIEVTDLRRVSEPTLFTHWEGRHPAGTDLPSPGPSREHRAEVLRKVAGAAAEAGRHGDSVRFAEEAQRLDPSASGSRIVERARRQTERQKDRKDAFRVGRALQDARRVQAAIDQYVKALPRDRTEARLRWATALTGTRRQAGMAFLWLAPRYVRALLVDQGLDLFADAETRGVSAAAEERSRQASTIADALVEASSLLMEIGDLNNAEAYAGAVTDYMKEDLRAAFLLAETRALRTGDGTKGLGHIVVGRAYRRAGALGEARKEFVAALGEQPLHRHAAEGLSDLLGLEWTASQRYAALLPAVSRLLAIDLLKRRELRRG